MIVRLDFCMESLKFVGLSHYRNYGFLSRLVLIISMFQSFIFMLYWCVKISVRPLFVITLRLRFHFLLVLQLFYYYYYCFFFISLLKFCRHSKINFWNRRWSAAIMAAITITVVQSIIIFPITWSITIMATIWMGKRQRNQRIRMWRRYCHTKPCKWILPDAIVMVIYVRLVVFILLASSI
jgi:ABC-type phosphate transport system permease subunit